MLTSNNLYWFPSYIDLFQGIVMAVIMDTIKCNGKFQNSLITFNNWDVASGTEEHLCSFKVQNVVKWIPCVNKIFNFINDSLVSKWFCSFCGWCRTWNKRHFQSYLEQTL